MNELEFTISNLSSTIVEDFKKYDLMIYSDDIINLKIFNIFSAKMFSFMFYSNSTNSKKYLDNKEKTYLGINQYLIDDEKLTESLIIEKILSFTRNP
jgi:hypothetical protein